MVKSQVTMAVSGQVALPGRVFHVVSCQRRVTRSRLAREQRNKSEVWWGVSFRGETAYFSTPSDNLIKAEAAVAMRLVD